MTVTNNTLYGVSMLVITLALIGFAAITNDATMRSVIIGGLMGYWFREGVAIRDQAKTNAERIDKIEPVVEDIKKD